MSLILCSLRDLDDYCTYKKYISSVPHSDKLNASQAKLTIQEVITSRTSETPDNHDHNKPSNSSVTTNTGSKPSACIHLFLPTNPSTLPKHYSYISPLLPNPSVSPSKTGTKPHKPSVTSQHQQTTTKASGHLPPNKNLPRETRTTIKAARYSDLIQH